MNGNEGEIEASPSAEVVDLSEEEAPPSTSSLEVATYDPAQDRERVRGRIAQILVWLLVGIVVVSLGAGVWLGLKTEEGIESLKLVLELVLTPIIGLVGAVTGFYFGEKSARH
jgi:hypothetical protein